ncbi:MAG: UDP-N-acetylmuramoyl-L-alanine--D-glutamate ligase [Planctomycetota bacterium]
MEFRNRRVTVMGLGSFGGGLGAVQFLTQRGAQLTVTDVRTAADLAEPLAQLACLTDVVWHLGGHHAADFTDTDLVVVSPAVPKDNPFLQLAIDAQVPLSSEMNLFWDLNPAPVIGMTGSNGKSTTTAMTHAILQATERTCWLGGNIGRSLLPLVDQIQPHDAVVLELSSFQLEDLDHLQRSPHVAIVTNFSANHLDRHGTLDNYRWAKQAILRYQTAADFAILNQDDPDVAEWPTPGRTLFFGLTDLGREGLFLRANRTAVFRFDGQEKTLAVPEWLSLPGIHNLQNALGAVCAACAFNVSDTAIEQGLRGYQALPHRLELVAEIGGRRFFNDSLATTPESAIVALAAFDQPIILFAGGYDKGSDLTEMARAIAAKPVKAVALMGKTGPHLKQLLDQFDPAQQVRRQVCENFDEAFRWAVSQSQRGDILLLSPGCASYDWFRNFVDRGAQFRNLAVDSQRLMADVSP